MPHQLIQFSADFVLPSPSPFCLKVETFLRMTGIPYENEAFGPGKLPLGKAPVVRMGTELVADSSVILRRLIDAHDLDLDARVDPDRLQLARAMTRVLEEHTYWALLHTRWVDDGGWASYRHVIGSSLPLPGPLKGLLLAWLRRGVRRSAHAHGLSRHPPAEIHQRAIEDIDALSVFIGDHDFLGGPAPCSHDASASAFLENLALDVATSPIGAHIRGDRRLTAYLHRMRDAAWPDREFPSL